MINWCRDVPETGAVLEEHVQEIWDKQWVSSVVFSVYIRILSGMELEDDDHNLSGWLLLLLLV